jgi:hypothetical protein
VEQQQQQQQMAQDNKQQPALDPLTPQEMHLVNQFAQKMMAKRRAKRRILFAKACATEWIKQLPCATRPQAKTPSRSSTDIKP